MRIRIGIDGGGTRARALAVDGSGRELGRKLGPPGIVRASDPCAAAECAADLTRSLLAELGETGPAAALCCGLAGAGREPEREAVRVALMLAGVADVVTIVGDAEAALADAFTSGPGILVIAGTGSIAWARAADGGMVRVGGWGLLLGDEGSGYVIGLEALRAVARSADGRDPYTSLSGAVLAATSCGSPDDRIRYGGNASKADIAALTPIVLAHADAGDAAAGAIRDRAVQALVTLTTTAAARAALDAPACALTGGLIAPGGALRDRLKAALEAALPGVMIREAAVDAARGAALLALEAAPD
jgi:N-acetylglucosamine kinase-like BadF-type ATPase